MEVGGWGFGIGEPRASNHCKLGSLYVAEKDELGGGGRSTTGVRGRIPQMQP
jgi:hypothetical protein